MPPSISTGAIDSQKTRNPAIVGDFMCGRIVHKSCWVLAHHLWGELHELPREDQTGRKSPTRLVHLCGGSSACCVTGQRHRPSESYRYHTTVDDPCVVAPVLSRKQRFDRKWKRIEQHPCRRQEITTGPFPGLQERTSTMQSNTS